MTAPIRFGTRGSALALAQCQTVIDCIKNANPSLGTAIIEVTSRGDADRHSRLDQMGIGVFTKALEDALQDDEIDVAVHSLKDMPSDLAPRFRFAAITVREDPREVLLNHWNCRFEDLPQRAVIGTGSPRRKAQLLAQRPDLIVKPMRGNVPTRIALATTTEDGQFDGAVLAAAGIRRLGQAEVIAEYLDIDTFVPAAGQGSLGLEIREGDDAIAEICAAADDPDGRCTAEAERAFLRRMQGGCSAPVAGHARLEDRRLTMTGFASSLDGQSSMYETAVGDPDQPQTLGLSIADMLLKRGAGALLAGAS